MPRSVRRPSAFGPVELDDVTVVNPPDSDDRRMLDLSGFGGVRSHQLPERYSAVAPKPKPLRAQNRRCACVQGGGGHSAGSSIAA